MATKRIEWYVEQAQDLVDRDKKLRDLQRGMDRLTDLEYQLPKALQSLEWMKTVRTTVPYDAVNAGARVLAGLEERIRIHPATILGAIDADMDSQEAKAKANEWEVALKWQMDKAVQRSPGLREAVTRSALKYDEIAGTLIHVPTQIKALEALGANGRRLDGVRRLGNHALLLKNPQNVHIRRSDFGPEAVLNVAVMTPQAIVEFWGDRAFAVRYLLRDEKAPDRLVLFDWCDFDERVVWCVPESEDSQEVSYDKKYKILKEPYEYSFLPTIDVIGHEDLERAPERQRYPLLYGVWKAESWLASNIIASLSVSESIATFAQPKIVKQAPDPDRIETDYTEPGGEVRVPFPPGTAEVRQLTQQPENPALRQAYERFIYDMRTATVPSVLISAEAGPNEPFSGYNLRIRQAIATLNPYKKLSEKFFEEAYRQMLYWCAETGETIPGYGKGESRRYEIGSSEIDTDAIYLSVELTPDVPLDRQEKINTAIMAHRELPIPFEELASELGITNPEGAVEQWMRERIDLAEFQGLVAKIQADASGEIQQMAMQIAQGMMQQQQQQQQQQQGPAPGAQGFNPAQGGQPAAEAAPGTTREARTGRTKLGEQRA